MAEKSDNRTPSYLLIGILVLLAVVFVAVMFSNVVEDCIHPFSEVSTKSISNKIEECVGLLLGLPEEKNEILIFLGISMGGILLTLQAWISYKRARAMEDTAKAQVKATVEQAIANQNTEKGLRQERLKNAIEHLGNDSDSVRLGGAYELFHLAQDNPELRQTVLDILCAHIRRTTGEDVYRKTHQSKPSEEVQSLLTLLFVQQHDVFKGLHINLQNSWLNGVNLRRARLQKADLTRAHLKKADLYETCLYGSKLIKACLHDADLQKAKLKEAKLVGTQFQGSKLVAAWLCGADLFDARLHGAKLIGVRFEGADLSGAQFQGADLSRAQFQGALLYGTKLHGVSCRSDDYDFAQRMRSLIGQKSDLSDAMFEGGLNKVEVDSIVEDLSDEKAKDLRKKLESHIGKQHSYGLPSNSRFIGAYTEVEAEKWIAEYEKAMSEVPTADE